MYTTSSYHRISTSSHRQINKSTRQHIKIFTFAVKKTEIVEQYILDDPRIEHIFQEILKRIKTLQNGLTSDSMVRRGIKYKINYGASIVSLQKLASNYKPDHLLAFKLWNKQWRETMILATLLEEPEKVTENQMDFWVKSFTTNEIAEQAVMNLFVKTSFAWQKAYDYCLGKKFLVKITGLLLVGRLALTDRDSPDECFDSFFELMPPLSKDSLLRANFARAYIQIGMRTPNLREEVLRHAEQLRTINSDVAAENAEEIIRSIT